MGLALILCLRLITAESRSTKATTCWIRTSLSSLYTSIHGWQRAEAIESRGVHQVEITAAWVKLMKNVDFMFVLFDAVMIVTFLYQVPDLTITYIEDA